MFLWFVWITGKIIVTIIIESCMILVARYHLIIYKIRDQWNNACKSTYSSCFTIERNERTSSEIKKFVVVNGDEVRWIFRSTTRECYLTVSQAGSVDSVSFYTVRFSYGIIALLLPGVGHCWSSLAERRKGNSGKWGRCPPVCSSDENPDNFVACVYVCSITSWFAARYVLFTALIRLELIVATARLRVVNICRLEQRSMALIARTCTCIAKCCSCVYRSNMTCENGKRPRF